MAVLGATGAVGQRMVRLLDAHPWFRVALLTGSERSAGRRYDEAAQWTQDAPIPTAAAALRVGTNRDAVSAGLPLAFSALDASVAGDVEREVAGSGTLVVSNARNHRMDPGVPLLVPEVNPDHLSLLDGAGGGAGARAGGIITNPNCSTIGIVMALAPLHRAVGVEAVHATTLQAISGAGMPGIPALSIHDNVVPFIAGEEEKLEREPAKILGEPGRPARIRVSAQCTRVPVTDGHTAALSVKLGAPLAPDEAARLLAAFRGRPQELGLPSAPAAPIVVHGAEDAPQPRRHAGLGGGMAVSVGRIRPCPILDLRMVVLSHNTVRGAAGGAILCAELALAEGRVHGVTVPGGALP